MEVFIHRLEILHRDLSNWSSPINRFLVRYSKTSKWVDIVTDRDRVFSLRPPLQHTDEPTSRAHPQHTDRLASSPPPLGHAYGTLLLASPQRIANGPASHHPPPGNAYRPLLLTPPSHHRWKAILLKSHPTVTTSKAGRRPQQDPPDQVHWQRVHYYQGFFEAMAREVDLF